MSELISVIVPVYNVEEYLEECLESIKNESVNDYVTMDSRNISFFSFTFHSSLSLNLSGSSKSPILIPFLAILSI